MDDTKKEFLRSKLIDMRKQAENNFQKMKQSYHAQTLINDFFKEQSENSCEIKRIQYKNLGEADIFLNRVNDKITAIMQEIETLKTTRPKITEYDLIPEFADLLLVEHEGVNYYTVQRQKMMNYKELTLKSLLGEKIVETKKPEITWKGTESQFIALFELLHENKLIDNYVVNENRQWNFIENIFLNRKNEFFKAKQLSKVNSKEDIEAAKKAIIQKLST